MSDKYGLKMEEKKETKIDWDAVNIGSSFHPRNIDGLPPRAEILIAVLFGLLSLALILFVIGVIIN